MRCVNGAGANVTVTDTGTGTGTGTGTTVATFSTGGFRDTFTGAIVMSGYGDGDHTVRVSVSAAATVAGVNPLMESPPLIAWMKPGPYVNGGADQQARLALFLAELQTVADDWANVVSIGHDADWDMDTMLYTDGFHPNDLGNAYYADRINTVLAARLGDDFEQGLNAVVGTSAGTYTPPVPVYTAPGATVPAQVTGLAATGQQGAAVLTWTRASDGGSTLTGYSVQYRVSGAGSWVDAPDATGTATGALTRATWSGIADRIDVCAGHGVAGDVFDTPRWPIGSAGGVRAEGSGSHGQYKGPAR